MLYLQEKANKYDHSLNIATYTLLCELLPVVTEPVRGDLK